MPRCPKCFYELVLLESRGRYKCSKCGRLYLQKMIETKDFVEWNKQERKKDREAFYGKPQKQKQLSEFEKKQKALAYQRKWRELHRERLLQKRRENFERLKDGILTREKLYRENNKLLRRINNLRTEQKRLALRMLESEDFSVSTH